MKTSIKHLVALAAVALTGVSASAADVPDREHRAIWMTPALSNNWPSTKITAGNASRLQSQLQNRMASFKAQGINVVYYHVRSFCDAMYQSSYEPWSTTVVATRGETPAFDPFEFLVKTAHENGIEVYAWINPYRYKTDLGSWGSHELNYENSHPDWLLKNNTMTCLNPGIDAVRQRIVDVTTEIVTKYDVDGVVFDDYFYPSGGLTTASSAGDYTLWQQKGGGLSIADWRRKNVNDMVHDVNAAIKKAKPYVVFGIAPAGVASGAAYGLTTPSNEWQYNQIYSDPLAWYQNGDIDFMSPQIYWPGRYTELTTWWNQAAQKYGRHMYPSVDLSSLSTDKTATFLAQIDKTREIMPEGTAGTVFFEYGPYINYRENVYGTIQSFGDNIHQGAYPTKALTPLRTWDPVQQPVFTADVKLDGTTLSWKEVPGMRYTVYAHGKTDAEPFAINIADLHGVSYTNSYSVTADEAAANDWYVAVYDRYGNEFPPLGIGMSPATATAPALTYPANGETPRDLFEFAWTSNLNGKFTVEVAADRDFAQVIGLASTGKKTLSVTALPQLEAGKTYWWRVRMNPVGAVPVVSAAQSFVAPRLSLTNPTEGLTGVSVTPTLTWTQAVDGADYKVEIANSETFSTVVYSADTKDVKATVPEKLLTSGTKYWARVTASVNDRQSQSAVVAFTTVDRTDYTAPALVNPATDGQTMHIDQLLEVEPWSGMTVVNIQIAASTSFPARSTANINLRDCAVSDKDMSSIKLSGKALVDGTTYYARVRGGYNLSSKSGTTYTQYGPTRSFVFSETAGVNDIVADGQADIAIAGNQLTAPAGAAVAVYTVDGRQVAAGQAVSGTYTLPDAPGAYIVVVTAPTAKATLKYAR